MGRLVGLALELEALPSLVEGLLVVVVAVEVDVPPDEVAVEVVLVAVDVELVAVEVDVLSLGVASVSDGEAVSVDEPDEDDDPLDDEPLGLSMAVASVPVAVDCVSLGEWVIGPDGGFPLASATARIGAATRPAPSTVMKAATVTAVRFDGVAGRLLGCACFIEVLTSLTARRGRTAPGGDGAPRS